MPADVIAIAGVPLTVYNPNPSIAPVAITNTQILKWIRAVEDKLEQDSGIRLCQTWISASPVKSIEQLQPINGYPYPIQTPQVLGVDYDIAEAGYDFRLPMAMDEGWMAMKLRWKPMRPTTQAGTNAVQSYLFTYPLLSLYAAIPIDWVCEDQDFSYIRLVPSRNVQVLPFLQATFSLLGFARSLPAALQIQYVAGLTPADYASEYSYVPTMIQMMVARMALLVAQGSINFGAVTASTAVDGLSRSIGYDKNGAYAGLINAFGTQAKEYLDTFKDKGAGPVLRFLGT